MTARHASFVALVGWYLMIPPPIPRMSPPVDFDAPLSEWIPFSLHDNVIECEQDLITLYKLAETELVANPTDEGDRIQFHQLESAQCITSDDPRLVN